MLKFRIGRCIPTLVDNKLTFISLILKSEEEKLKNSGKG